MQTRRLSRGAALLHAAVAVGGLGCGAAKQGADGTGASSANTAGETESASSGELPTGGTTAGSADPDDTSLDGPAETAGASEGEDPKFDLGVPDGGRDTQGGCENERCECETPAHVPCDDDTTDPFQAIGLNCAGELPVQASTMGPASAIGVRSSMGLNATFDPREGELYAVIGSGFVADLEQETPLTDDPLSPAHCNDDLGAFDPGYSLPPPLVPENVAGDCIADPTLVGTGDCSNTIEGQFSQGGGANDYVELRFELDVPADIVSFSYDFAFFSVEYPAYYGSQYNDMYIGWLESEAWTGNISFDGNGNPISLNAGFLDLKDDLGILPEFAGTCMRRHAGMSWLTTSAGVTPGEHITVVFAIFDLSDSILDSYAYLDNFRWSCVPVPSPGTEPEG